MNPRESRRICNGSNFDPKIPFDLSGFTFPLHGGAPPNIQTISSDREHSCEGEQRKKAQDEDWQVKWAQWNLKRKKEGKELTFFFFTDC